MANIYINKKQIDFSGKLVLNGESQLLSDKGTYSLRGKAEWTDNNKVIFGFLHLPIKKTNKTIIYDNAEVRSQLMSFIGSLKITSYTNNYFNFYFTGSSDFTSKAKSLKLSDLKLGGTIPYNDVLNADLSLQTEIPKAAFLPIKNEVLFTNLEFTLNYNDIVNDYDHEAEQVDTRDKNPRIPFFNLNYIIKQIFNEFGYIIEDNAIEQDPDLKLLYLVNNYLPGEFEFVNSGDPVIPIYNIEGNVITTLFEHGLSTASLVKINSNLSFTGDFSVRNKTFEVKKVIDKLSFEISEQNVLFDSGFDDERRYNFYGFPGRPYKTIFDPSERQPLTKQYTGKIFIAVSDGAVALTSEDDEHFSGEINYFDFDAPLNEWPEGTHETGAIVEGDWWLVTNDGTAPVLGNLEAGDVIVSGETAPTDLDEFTVIKITNISKSQVVKYSNSTGWSIVNNYNDEITVHTSLNIQDINYLQPADINPKHHVPDINIFDFIKNMGKFLGIQDFQDLSARYTQIISYNKIFKSNESVDITKFVNVNSEGEINKYNGFRLSSDIDKSDKLLENIKADLSNYNIKSSVNSYDDLIAIVGSSNDDIRLVINDGKWYRYNSSFAGVTNGWKLLSVNSQDYITDEGEYIHNTNFSTGVMAKHTLNDARLPQFNIPAKASFLEGPEMLPRLIFLRGMGEILSGAYDYPISTTNNSDHENNDIGELSLEWDGDKGLYAKRLKPLIDWELHRREDFTTKIYWPASLLHNFKFFAKYKIINIKYLVKRFKITLFPDDTFEHGDTEISKL